MLIIKKMILPVLALVSSVGYAEQLVTFADIAAAVAQGEKITFVMNLEGCNGQNMTVNSAIGSVSPNAFMVIDNNRITASDRHFTLENPMARGKPIFEFVKFNINLDGSVSIKNTLMNAVNYEQITSYQVDCKLNKGFKVFS